MHENNYWVESVLGDRGVALLGFADLSEIEMNLRKGFQYGISFAMPLSKDIVPKIIPGPSMEYYNELERVSQALKETSIMLVERIKERGFDAYSLSFQKQNEDYRTPLPLKTLATRSGLGWIGKSAALVTKEYGNVIRLSGVLTDMAFETGSPIDSSMCGGCEECVKNCPGKAIKGKEWDVHTDRDDLLDAFQCKKTVMERGEKIGKSVGSCGICLAVCPWTKSYMQRVFDLRLKDGGTN